MLVGVLLCALVVVTSGAPVHNVHKQLLRGHTPKDLEIKKVQRAWSPYDPSLGNTEAIIDKLGTMTTKKGELTEKQKQIQQELLKLQVKDAENNDGEDPDAFEPIKSKTNKQLERFLNSEHSDFPCSYLVLSRSTDAPRPQPEQFRDASAQIQQRTASFVLDTFLNNQRPLYTSGSGHLRSGVEPCLEEMFQLLEMDTRPLVTQVTFLSGFDSSVTWVIQSINGRMRIYQASPSGSYGLVDWLTPQEWQLRAVTSTRKTLALEDLEIPRPQNDFEAAKFGFGSSMLLSNSSVIAYRNNVRQFLAGLCATSPPVEYYFSAVALWGSPDGIGHSSNCNMHYETYLYEPELCYQKALTDRARWVGGEKAFPEFGFEYS